MFRLEPSVDVMFLSYFVCGCRVGSGWIVGKEDVVLLGTAVGNSVSKNMTLQQHQNGAYNYNLSTSSETEFTSIEFFLPKPYCMAHLLACWHVVKEFLLIETFICLNHLF